MVRRRLHDVGAVFERDEGGEIVACDYCFAASGAPHNTGCKYSTGVAVKASTTDNYWSLGAASLGLADAQLQRDIEAARGVKPAFKPTDIADTLAERGKRYGEFKDHAFIAQGIKRSMDKHPGWSRLDDDMKQALEVIADKIARILNGDPAYSDNWHDIAGYAKLVDDRLQGQTPDPEPKNGAPITDGWVEWHGGENPAGAERVKIRHRRGTTAGPTDAFMYRWTDLGEDTDIVAYRIV